MLGRQFVKNVKVKKGNSPDAALNTASTYPTAAAVDVKDYEYVDVLVSLGAVTGTPKFQILQTDASTGGTLDTIDSSMTHTIASTDDDELLTFNLQVNKLASDHHFVQCKVTGSGAGDYGDILFLLRRPGSLPVTQATATCPTANQGTYAG